MVKRTPIKISVENVRMGNPTGDTIEKKKGIKESGAWRYPGGVIQRAPSKVLGPSGKAYYDDKDPSEARRKHESNFFICLNTNRYCGTELDGAIARDGKRACEETLKYLSEDKVICNYLKFGPKHHSYRDDIFEEVIFKIEWQAAVETGENLERLHCHIWLTLHHYSQVQINMPVMQKVFKAKYNSLLNQAFASKLCVRRNPYISVKLLPSSDHTEVMKRYIHKAMMDCP